LRSLLSEGGEGVAATAYLTLHDREYRFHLTQEILERLEYAPQQPASVSNGRIAETAIAYSVGSSIETPSEPEDDTPSFDSMVEARLYREFKSLEREGHTHGWRLEREPDPLLAPGVVLIPDFAFTRGETRVFMEVAGFWSPSYREKKVSKLRALSASDDTTPLILAMPHEAMPAFQGLPFPIAPYKNAVRATDMLSLLDTHYGNREAREDAAKLSIDALRSAALERGFVPEREVAEVVQAYTRSELLASVASLGGENCVYIAGVGLLSCAMLDEVHAQLDEALASSGGQIPLDDASNLVSSILSVAQVDIEPLLGQWPHMHIDRPSLFEAYLAG